MESKKIVLSYCKSLFPLMSILLLLGSCHPTQVPQNQNYYYSPISAIGVGPNGLPTAKIEVQPYCCPSTAIEILSSSGASDNDFQWVNIPLSVPEGIIKSVTVCYNVETAVPGQTFISQVRLSRMTTPDSAAVLHDDGTDLGSTSPTCYTSNTDVTVDGTITLALRVAVGSSDAIQIGGITLEMQ